ncbi:hypothetical protein BJX66DRAFT_318216 [Aspergillus keveii]|uniref:Uncharacterized protein n=1 Tax=Aspergillus keveii TaxID=714993 RepID=A0ABR4FK71_9EURO
MVSSSKRARERHLSYHISRDLKKCSPVLKSGRREIVALSSLQDRALMTNLQCSSP